MSLLDQDLHINPLTSSLRSRLSPTMDHRKVKCGTCSVPSTDASHCCCYHHLDCHQSSACRHYSYSMQRHCNTATTAAAKTTNTCEDASHDANEKSRSSNSNRNNNKATARWAASNATKSGQNSKTSHSAPGLALFALLNLTLLVTHCSEVASAPAPTNGQSNAESSIRVTRFQVPAQVRPGERRRLTCLYQLNGATLHAMKLFKDDKEFYRYTPSPDAPSDRIMTFPVVGVNVDLNHSNEHEVWLKTNKRSSGQYKCQVSIEGTFNSISAERRMEVVDGSQFGPGTGQASSGHLAGASLWQQPQQYDTGTTNRQQQQSSFSMTSPRAQPASQRHGYQANGAPRSIGASSGVGVSSDWRLCCLLSGNLAWPLLILVSFVVQIAATRGATMGFEPKRTAHGHQLDPHLALHPPLA